jgi:hypothetical protein
MGGGASFGRAGGGATFGRTGGSASFAATAPSGRVGGTYTTNRGYTGDRFAAGATYGNRTWTGRTTGWNGGSWRHDGGWWPGAGFAAGVALGDAYAYYGGPYYNDYYYDYGPDTYYDTGVVAPVAPGGDAVAYCESRFRSYDPASGTYLGYDGLRHPCP